VEVFLDFVNKYIMGGIQIWTEFIFFTAFLGKRRRAVYGIVFSVCGLLLIEPVQSGGAADVFLYTLLLAGYGIFVCRADWASAFLYAVITAGIMQLCYGVVNLSLYILYPYVFPFWQEKTGILFMVLGYAAFVPAVLGYRVIAKYYRYQDDVRNRYVLLLLLPVLVIFLMGSYINLSIYKDAVTVYEDGSIAGGDHYQMLMVQVLGLASMFSILSACKKLLENFRLSTELALLSQQERYLHQYVEEAREQGKKTKAFRHDIKNHIMVVKELLQSGKRDQALCYISDLDGMVRELSFSCNTGNPVVDILIGNKFGMAKSGNIDTDCSLILPYPCKVRDIDFCIILSNALDNAISACREMDDQAGEGAWESAWESESRFAEKKDKGDQNGRKYIHISGRHQGDFILLEVENSFSGHGTIEKGTGLSNIEVVAKKYGGAMSVKCQAGRFLLSVLLNLTV
jgi:hypothetical protein